ncbi:hypothetical protein ACHWQZ_G007738 [Mnemiopsis leidyi]
MEVLMETLQNGTSAEKATALEKFNQTYDNYNVDNVSTPVIESCLDLIFDNIDEVSLQSELLLFCKTIVKIKRVAACMTPQLFVRMLELGQLTNIHEESEFSVISLQARRAVFNTTYHNSLCQAACFEAQADLNLFDELQTYHLSQELERRLISCKMAFLFTAVSESMRNRVIEHDAMSILHNVVCQTIYGDELQPHCAKISCGKKRTVKPGSITLCEDDLVISADVFMAVFNITLHWDKNTTTLECTDNVERFIHQIKCIYEGLNFSEKNDKYQTMITKFLPIMINVSAQFPELFLPPVDESFKGTQFMGRDMSMPKGLLKQLEVEGGRKSGNKMIMMSILAVLNRLVCVRSCRKYLRKEILPPLGKVTKRPEEETHLIKSKVVKLMTHIDNSISVLTSELLFNLCKQNVNRMIKYTGYGNSAGLFNRHGLLGMGGGGRRTEEDMSPDEDSDTEEYRTSFNDVDLVTAGPARENTALKNMTEAEKEVEANRLINLIDDMHRKGVIKPGSPPDQ